MINGPIQVVQHHNSMIARIREDRKHKIENPQRNNSRKIRRNEYHFQD